VTEESAVADAGESPEFAALTSEVKRLRATNEMLRTYAYTAAHELAAPARRVLMHLELLDSAPDPDAYEERIEKIRMSASTLTGVVTDLLDLASLDFHAFLAEPVALRTLIEDVFSEAASVCTDETHIRIGAIPDIEGNEVLLRRLFSNLADNAVKFRRPGLPLIIEIESEARPSGTVVLSVSDNGIGVDGDDAASIFAPLVRLQGKSEFKGAGIGLAVCRRIAQWHRGGIVAQPNLGGVGTTIMVTLRPVSEDVEPDRDSAPPFDGDSD